MGMDNLDNHKPPLFRDQGFLYFPRRDWNAVYPRFSSDFRPSLGDGQVWDFEVSNPRESKAKIRFDGIERIPGEYQVLLVNMMDSAPVDLRRTNEYSYLTVSPTMQFKMIVGTEDFIHKEISLLMPKTFELVQNFPNPFNNSTSISVHLPEEADIRLIIYNSIGQRVRVLAEGRYAAGVHTFVWNGTDDAGQEVATGIYFYRFNKGAELIQTRKMLLIK
jgi:hypothetical protein